MVKGKVPWKNEVICFCLKMFFVGYKMTTMQKKFFLEIVFSEKQKHLKFLLPVVVKYGRGQMWRKGRHLCMHHASLDPRPHWRCLVKEASIMHASSLVPRPYLFLLLSLFIKVKKNRQNEAAKKEMGVQLRKSKAWFGKSRDPQGFLWTWAICIAVRYSPTHSELSHCRARARAS